ncbi:carbon starvation protein A [Blastopirellula marina]|uniref:Carbon starvation protein A n=1 Tax=Blastopirellula marina TaxID=124 RepID=A0A2S8FPN2_9BACT|nr:carbon starvation protein A [Blastopirellula marina]PQO33980.1 carbon starvation protein A [Blastopirellula marina]PTL43766.1 carbon starvation protein A [Blastopirellula marina]
MSTLIVAVLSFVGFIVAYHTYGHWLSKKIFNLDDEREVPSKQLQDDVDFVPTDRQIVFGHHFTSIAGTGPIVGPAIAVFWGWLPALLWVIFGSIFVGAVHDLGSLIVSLRNRGQTVGEIAGRMINKRAKYLFLLVLASALMVVLAIFGLVVAVIFANYPQTVLPVWISMPIAIAMGLYARKKDAHLLVPSLVALAIVYLSILVGVYYLPIDLAGILTHMLGESLASNPYLSPLVVWTVILLAYCFVASVLPVWLLLQPRDYVNSHQLLVALALLFVGLLVASFTGAADLIVSTPSVATELPAGAPPLFPFLFITIACGACSGFHCLVSSGTSSKQVEKESDAQYIGYGAMLLEGGLAVIVILACCAGVGMGLFDRVPLEDGGYTYAAVTDSDGAPIVGRAAWERRYDMSKGWGAFGLPDLVAAFVEGGANFLTAIGIPLEIGISIIAVLVANFAATTLDTATRLQRYVMQELLVSTPVTRPLSGKYSATGIAVISALAIAVFAGPVPGAGGKILWPLFGAMNQLLAGLAMMVTAFYLWRRNQPIWFVVIPMIGMLIFPAWAMYYNLFSEHGYLAEHKTLLSVLGISVLVLQAWMVVEAILMWPRVRGVLEDALPPLPDKTLATSDAELPAAQAGN